MTTIDLDNIHLDKGGHSGPDNGYCLMEWVSMLAGEPFSEQPKCVSPYLRRFGIRLNDLATDTQRQDLIQFGPRVLGTAGDGLDEKRRWIGADHAVRVAMPRWLAKAGLTDHADALRALDPITNRASYVASRLTVNAARDAAYQARSAAYGGKTRYEYFRDAVRAKLAEGGKAVAVADAVAAAAAAAVAVAAADADAVAAAVADAAADAAAAAAADAVAAADADADAVAAAAYSYDSKRYWAVRDAAYKAARAVYEERYADLIAESWSDALALFDRLINPAA